MFQSTMIATCCYCGNRTRLDLASGKRSELACAACSAPLRNMKPLKVHEHAQTMPPAERAGPPQKLRGSEKHAAKRKKKRKSAAKRFFDIAEEILDILD